MNRKQLLFYVFSLVIFQNLTAQARTAIINQAGIDTINGMPFLLTGEVNGMDTGRLFIWIPAPYDKWRCDTAYLTDGKFQFSGNITEPTYCFLKQTNKDGYCTYLFLESGQQHIVLQEGDFDNFKMTGSFSQNQEDSLKGLKSDIIQKMKKPSDLYDSLNRLYIHYSHEKDSAKLAPLEKQLDSIRNEILWPLSMQLRDIEKDYIITHPDSYVSATHLYSLFREKLTAYDQAVTLYGNLSQKIKTSRIAKQIQEEIKDQGRNQPGSMAPEIVTKDIKGQNFSLDQLKGKYILIDFWASWCGPCRQAIPHLKELYKRYHPNGLEVITLSLDDRPVEWTEAVSKEKLNDFYNILVDTKIKKDYLNAIMPIPNQILIDKSGKIIWNTIHEKENESIDDILKQYVN